MGTYCYALRAKTKNVNVDGEFRQIPVFEYSYKPSWGFHWEHNASYQRMVGSKLAAAERAFDKFAVTPEGGGPRLVVALDGEWVVVTTRDHYLDGESLEHYHKFVIGKVVKVGGRLQCVAQNTTTDLAIQSLGYAAQDARRKLTPHRG